MANNLPIKYQNIISLKSTKILGLEANIAWSNCSGKLIPLEEIGYLAKKTGFIPYLNQYLLTKVCQQIIEYQKKQLQNSTEVAKSGFKIAVNLSSWQFLQSNLSGLLERLIKDYQIDPKCLALIVNEQAFHTNASLAIKNLKNLQQLSIYTSINHIGTYYLSLAEIHGLAVDNLRIDSWLLKEIRTNQLTREIYGEMIKIAHSLNMTVTADGISNEEQLNALQGLNCEFGQGSWISQISQPQPVPVS
ncbi:MAG: EAL domain-containing protein [Cyanobacteria bacterium J06558_2]